MFEIKAKTSSIILPSGVACTVCELNAGHQGTLTKKGKVSDKMNKLVAELIVDIEGYSWGTMSIGQKIAAIRLFLSGDRKYILSEARQLTMSYPENFTFYHEYKTSEGVKKTESFDVVLITESNRLEIIETIKKQCPHSDIEIIERLNKVGMFPTRPYKTQFTAYPIETSEIEPILENIIDGYELCFRMLTGQCEEAFTPESDSNTRLEARKLRARKIGAEAWEAVTLAKIQTLPAPISDAIITQIAQHEGDVDTVEIRDDEDGKKLVELTGEISFFFPSGKV